MTIIPIVIGAFGTVTKRLHWFTKINFWSEAKMGIGVFVNLGVLNSNL